MNINDIIAGVSQNPALAETIGKLGIEPERAQSALSGVLSQLSEGHDVTQIASGIAESAGLEISQVMALLPGAVAALQGQVGGAGGDLVTGLLGKLQGGQFGDVLASLDANNDGSVVDDAVNLVKGFLSGKA
jgi:hypothetical protein